MSEENRAVELVGGSPWGFSIQGGADFRAPLKVTKVSLGGKADLAGVAINDIIKEICGRDSTPLRHSEALYLIRTAGTSLSLLLQHGSSAPAPYLPPKQLIRSSTAPAPRNPRKKALSPEKSLSKVPASSPGETEGVGGHEWHKAMPKSGASSGDELGPLSSSGEERRVKPAPRPLKSKPKSLSQATPSNGSVPSPVSAPDPPAAETQDSCPSLSCQDIHPENTLASQNVQSPPAEPSLPAEEPPTKKKSVKKRRELKPPPADSALGLYDFTAETKHELSFKKGDKLKLLRTVDKNWLEAQLDDKKGIVPASYVEVAPQTTQPLASGPQAVAKFDFVAEESYELGFQMGDTIKLLSRVDDNWLQGRLGDTTGIFPAAFVDILIPFEPSSPLQNATPVENEIRKSASPQREGDLYRAVYAYLPQNADELGLEVGADVHVIRKCEDGWFMGYHAATGAFGTFPGNYVQPI